MTERVLVTGGAGNLGANVIRLLRTDGVVVRALTHTRPVGDIDETAKGDLRSGTGLREAMTGVDIVVHLAALTHARRDSAYMQVNADGTRRLVDAALTEGIRRFVHVSTRAIDARGGGYSRSKAAAESFVSTSGIEAVILRLSEVYGAGGREGLDRIVALVRQGRRVPVVGDGSDAVCPVYVEDVAMSIAAAARATNAAGKTYTLAGDCLPTMEFIHACATAAGRDTRTVRLPVRLIALAGIASRFLPLPIYPDQLARLTSPKAQRSDAALLDLKFDPRPLSAGLSLALGPA